MKGHGYPIDSVKAHGRELAQARKARWPHKNEFKIKGVAKGHGQKPGKRGRGTF